MGRQCLSPQGPKWNHQHKVTPNIPWMKIVVSDNEVEYIILSHKAINWLGFLKSFIHIKFLVIHIRKFVKRPNLSGSRDVGNVQLTSQVKDLSCPKPFFLGAGLKHCNNLFICRYLKITQTQFSHGWDFSIYFYSATFYWITPKRGNCFGMYWVTISTISDSSSWGVCNFIFSINS